MKRERQLGDVVDEVIEKANRRDGQGRVVHIVMEEPVVIALFYARFAFINVLENRPLALLNLLSTNKALNAFFSEFDKIWPLLLDRFVESEASTYFSEIYPFILKQNLLARDGDLGPTQVHLFMKNVSTRSTLKVPRPQRYLYLGELKGGGPYYLVYYDELTRRYVDLLQRVKDFRRYMRIPLSPDAYLRQYVGAGVSLIAYHEYFLLDKAEPLTLAYDIDAARDNLDNLVKVLTNYRVAPGQRNKVVGNHVEVYLCDAAITELEALRVSAQKLQKWLRARPDDDEVAEPVKYILLDGGTAQTVSRDAL